MLLALLHNIRYAFQDQDIFQVLLLSVAPTYHRPAKFILFSNTSNMLAYFFQASVLFHREHQRGCYGVRFILGTEIHIFVMKIPHKLRAPSTPFQPNNMPTIHRWQTKIRFMRYVDRGVVSVVLHVLVL